MARSSFFWVTATGFAIAFGCATGTPLATDGDRNADAGDDAGASPCTPNGPEICDGLDNDCNGMIDEGFDQDKDTYFQCQRGALPPDCNDKDPNVHPSATEICNGIDDNCDGTVDEGFDKDNDHFFACPHPLSDGGTSPKDCDDNDVNVYPGALETCDKKDNDCNGKADDIPAQVTLNDTFQPAVDPHWVPQGVANINQTLAGWARLTPNVTGQGGALWWNTSQDNFTFDHFRMDCTIRIVRNPINQGADGMAFVWVPEANADAGAPGVGLPGGGFGLLNLGGYGVALDSYMNDGTEPTPPFTAVVSGTSGMHLIRNTTPLGATAPLLDGNPHALSVTLVTSNIALGDGGLEPQSAVTVTIDGTVFINQFVIPGYTPYRGKWGFTAATGGLSEEHYVTNVSMRFPDGQGCIQ